MGTPLMHCACDAVSVSRDCPDRSDPASPAVYVGFSNQALPNDPPCPPHGRYIGLVQFPPLPLPQGRRIASARLFLLVCAPHCRPVRVEAYQNLAPFDGRTVTYRTRPAAAPVPLGDALVTPQSQMRYVSWDVTALLGGGQGILPRAGFSLVTGCRDTGMVAFCAHGGAYPPYLEITCEPSHDRRDSLVENLFRERVFDLHGAGQPQCTPVIGTAGVKAVTFFVKNTGAEAFAFHLEISPDGLEFVPDPQKLDVEAGEMKAATPYLFGRFMRACLNPKESGQCAAARVWCQAQTNHYMVRENSWPDAGAPAMPLPGAPSPQAPGGKE